MLNLNISKFEIRLIKKALSTYCKNANEEEKKCLKDIINLINYQTQ